MCSPGQYGHTCIEWRSDAQTTSGEDLAHAGHEVTGVGEIGCVQYLLAWSLAASLTSFSQHGTLLYETEALR